MKRTMSNLFLFIVLTTLLSISVSAREKENTNLKSGESRKTSAQVMLDSWLKAHNSSSSDTLASWMKESYSPEMFDKFNYESNLSFYVESTKMFGKLETVPIKIVKNEEFSLIVHLVEEGYELGKEDDGLHTIIVEIDIDPQQPAYLARGLGVGNLVCAIMEDRKDLISGEIIPDKK